MVYVWDMVFIFFYLACEKVTTKIQNNKLRWFFKIRELMQWLQFLSIILYLYGRPVHNSTERLVSFGAMAFTKLVFDFTTKIACQKERARMIDKYFKNKK